MITFLATDVLTAFRDQTRLRKWLIAVVKDHGHSVGELNYVLMSDQALLQYNRDFLGHDEYTDVITFDGDPGSTPDVNSGAGGTGISGDVLMSLDRITDNAKTFGVSVQHELHRVMVHGLLHLLGHSDKSIAKRKSMSALENKYLEVY